MRQLGPENVHLTPTIKRNLNPLMKKDLQFMEGDIPNSPK